MGYSEAKEKMSAYRSEQIAGLMGERSSGWFLSLWGGISDMLKTFGSEKENQTIAARYSSAPSLERIAGHLRLDYVCGLRREIRKQYVSGEDDLFTDVTALRHGIISTHGAQIFDNALDTVIGYSESQASGGATA